MVVASRPEKTSLFATLRSKGQLTIPSELREELGWEEGERLIFVKTDRGIRVETRATQIARLAGLLSEYADPANQFRSGKEILDLEERAIEEAVLEDVLAE